MAWWAQHRGHASREGWRCNEGPHKSTLQVVEGAPWRQTPAAAGVMAVILDAEAIRYIATTGTADGGALGAMLDTFNERGEGLLVDARLT
eukprot:scaffold144077_cov31-Tisochrysis_lutea.AAC.2